MAKTNAFNKAKGSIEVICGPMFAGKTDELIRKLRRMEYADVSYVVFKPKIDTRDKNVLSRTGLSQVAIEVNTPYGILEYLMNAQKEYDVIAIDESQFFNNELVDVCSLLAKHNYVVIVSGLDRDFKGEPFGPIPSLLTHADFVSKLTAICDQCGGSASWTQRLINDEPADYDSPLVLIGDTESYRPRCRQCHIISNKPLSDLEIKFLKYTGKFN